MIKNGAEILIEELVAHGVDTVFGYPGGAVLNIYDELYKNKHRINHVITAHEQGAAHAADGYARASGKTGVVIATSGPGATNLVTGIANAYLDSVPMVAITGNVAVNLLGRDSFQEVDIIGITQAVVKHNFIVRDVKDLEKTLKEAFIIARTGRKGPVLVDIPKNIQLAKHEYNNTPVKMRPPHKRPEPDYAAALEAIKHAKKPFIYAGGGIISGGAEQEVLELSKRICAPVGLSMMGLGGVPSSYELNLGMCGMHGKHASSLAQSEADLMIAVGARFSDRATGNVSEYTKNCTVIHIDIDAAEIDKNVSSKISICEEAKTALTRLLQEIPPMKNEAWLKEIAGFKKRETHKKDDSFSPKNIIETVNSHMDKDAVIVTDVGQHQMWTAQFYKFEKTRRFLTSGGLGAMGFGLGAAIGGCMASGKRTVLFTGDGSFGMNLHETATAVTQNLPIVIIVMNNGVLGMVRQWQHMFYDDRFSQTTLLRKTDFPKLAEAFGARGFSVMNLSELETVLKNLPNGPCLIDCRINMDERVLPMIPPGGSIKNIVTE